jgi:hypothetical protein
MSVNVNVLEPWLMDQMLTAETLFVEAVYDDYEGFRVLMKGTNTEMLRITFKNKISYMNTDESFRLDIGLNNTNNNELVKTVFFVVRNSSYIELIKATSKQSLHPEAKHFAIYTDFDCIDVIAKDAPLVEWLS